MPRGYTDIHHAVLYYILFYFTGFVVHNDTCPKVKVPAARYKCLTMDDMLIPSGSWKDHHKKRNAYYNTVFIIGLTSLVVSIICVSLTKTF